jgi:hypothetical protein
MSRGALSLLFVLLLGGCGVLPAPDTLTSFGDDDDATSDDDDATSDDDDATSDDDDSAGDDDDATSDDDDSAGDDDDSAGDDDDSTLIDGDFDGQTVADGDCDDGDPYTYLGAPELCDGVDNSCDGTVPTNELDGDSDNYVECSPWVGGGLLDGGDCGPTVPTVNPGAVETCDGVDQDCDGEIDSTLACAATGCTWAWDNGSARALLLCTTLSFQVSWTAAESACQGLGYELASASTGPAWGQLSTLASQVSGGQSSFWLGGTDAASEGTWVWSDGQPFTFSAPWAMLPTQQPDGLPGDADCMVADNTGMVPGVWRDEPCTSPYGYVCATAP